MEDLGTGRRFWKLVGVIQYIHCAVRREREFDSGRINGEEGKVFFNEKVNFDIGS